jgi:hypothetical protein
MHAHVGVVGGEVVGGADGFPGDLLFGGEGVPGVVPDFIGAGRWR